MVISPLVLISVNGTIRGEQKAHKLLMRFLGQDRRDPTPIQTHQLPESGDEDIPDPESKPLSKSISRRKVGRAWIFLVDVPVLSF